MNTIIKRTWNQNRMMNIEDLRGMAFQAEDGGHTFEISGINDANEAVSLSGTVAGVFMRPDGTDVALTGTASDGVVSVTLSDACYAVAGRFGLTIFVTADSKKSCVYACIGTVAQTSYGTVAGDTPQDVVDLINAINAAIASIPADYSDLLDAIAPAFSTSVAYSSGAIVWYDGNLYQFTADKAAGSWDATKAVSIAISDINKSQEYNVPALNTDYLKPSLDNFQRATGETLSTGYTSIGVANRGVIDTAEDGKTKIAKVNNDANGLLLLTKKIDPKQFVCFSGTATTLLFNIKSSSDFYFLRTYANGFQLYKRQNSSIFISNIKTDTNGGFVVVSFDDGYIRIFVDYIYRGSYYLGVPFDGTVGMGFGFGNSESYSTFGVSDYFAERNYIGFINTQEFINNGADGSAVIDNTGKIKLLVDRSGGYSDGTNYRSMIRFDKIPYDDCTFLFECKFRLDESLAGADNFLIIQAHDNNLSEKGMSPFISINVTNYDGAQRIDLNSRYANWLPSGNLDCNIMDSVTLCDFDTEWHTLRLESRIGYNEGTIPYIICSIDGETKYAAKRQSGYYGQKGYNITYGIYGWRNPDTSADWRSPQSNSPFIEFKDVKYTT